MQNNLVDSPLFGVVIGAIFLFCLFYIFRVVYKNIFLNLFSHKVSDNDISETSIFNALPNCIFAAADTSVSTTRELEEIIRECAVEMKKISPRIDVIYKYFSRVVSSYTMFKNGKISKFNRFDFVEKFHFMFCIGHSLEGMGIVPNSVLTILNVDGAGLKVQIRNWQMTNTLIAKSKISTNDYSLDLVKNELKLPDGNTIEKGDVVSLKMIDETKNIYLKQFASVEGCDVESVELEGDISKVRIFGGFVLSQNNEIEIICYRQPEGNKTPIKGTKAHPISNLNGLVTDMQLYEEVL